MEKKLIVRIAEGLGNQLFMYANGYALSKDLNYVLYIDDKSGFIKTKNFRNYYLDRFNLSSQIISDDEKFHTNFLNIKRKIFKKVDFFKTKKSFLIEKKNKNKRTHFYDIKKDNYSDKLYVEGHFESELFFLKYRNHLLDEFSFKDEKDFKENRYYNMIKSSSENIVSISIRTNRFSEREGNKFNITSINNSNQFIRDTIEYVFRAIKKIKLKIPNAKFLVWSNNFSGLREYFPENEFTFVDNKLDKIYNDFYLFSLCKNFIVGPTTFHWWGAWLNNNVNKICIRPSNLNPSNNENFWPKNWFSI